MSAGRQALSRRSFVRAAGALALGATMGFAVRDPITSEVAEGFAAEAGQPGTVSFPTIEFGEYPQGAEGEVEPIEWYVLEERDGMQLLLSKYILDVQVYNEELTSVTWETCTLRAWLNTDFLDTAFWPEEQERVAEVEIANPDNLDHKTPGGNKTRDRAFCLSLEEVMKYFGVRRTWKQLGDELGKRWFLKADGTPNYEKIYAEEPGYKATVAYATDYARAKGVWTLVEPDNPYAGGSLWCLRTPGRDSVDASGVDADGVVDSYGNGVDYSLVGVRPALWLYL